MSTSKRKRKYSQDFSGKSRTDASFAPACDVNNIVRHYQTTGIDPHADRIQQARYDEASTLSYEDAMRNKAAYDSYMLENPVEEHSVPPTASPVAAPDDEVVAKPPPEAASQAKTEAE